MRDFQTPGRSAVYAQNGMAATSHPLATKVALDTLQQGGNAVDAAVAAALMLPLCEPSATGLFGDAFALIKPAGDERIIGINGSGPAPAALSAAAMRADGLATVPTKDARAVTLPGAVAAFERMLQDHGLLGWAEVAAPAIHYADAGVPVAPRVAFDWAAFAPELRGAARRHYLIDDAAPRPGQLFRAPGQAEVLRRISADGAAGFYQGEVAADLIESLQALGGCHSLADMAGVSAELVQPISADYRGLELVELPPNGQGITALLMAKILAHFDLAALAPFGAERAHIEAEAAKLAYDARNRFVADPRHVPDPAGHPGASAAAIGQPSRPRGPHRPRSRHARPAAADRSGAPRYRVSDRRRPRTLRGVADLFDLPWLWQRAGLRAFRADLPEPRRRLLAG